MKLEALTSNDLIILDQDYSSKREVFQAVADRLKQKGTISNTSNFIDSLYAREKDGPTGMDKGVAIPHAKSSQIKEPVFSIVRTKKPIDDWESIQPDNKVSLIFLLAIPKSDAGDFHVKLLAKLSRAMLDDQFISTVMKASSTGQVMAELGRVDEQEAKDQEKLEGQTKGLILGVTACPTGIAHTYMAAEAIERTAKAMGYSVKVEKQGANGIEDRPSVSEIKKAKGIIFAHDVELHDLSVYNGLPYIDTSVSDPIKDAKPLITRVVTNPDGKFVAPNEASDNTSAQENGGKKSLGTELYQTLMSGISYMIPVVVGAGLMSAIPQIGGLLLGLKPGTISNVANATSANQAIQFFYHFNQFGGFIFSLMYPVLAGFIAYTLAGKVGFAPGFIGGGLAGGLIYTVNGIKNHISSGFLGAIVIGFVAGYMCRWLNQKIKLSKNIQSLKPMLIIPLLSITTIYILNLFILEPIGGGLNKALVDIIGSTSGVYSVAIIMGFATALDMGGPVNKAAFAVTLALAANHSFPMTANVISSIIPPLGTGLAVMLNQYLFHFKIYDDRQISDGYTSFISGVVGVSEGAIPFALRKPAITIPMNMIGAAVAAVLATAFGAEMWFPIPQFWGWPLISHLAGYLIALLAGMLVVAIGDDFLFEYSRRRKIAKDRKTVNAA